MGYGMFVSTKQNQECIKQPIRPKKGQTILVNIAGSTYLGNRVCLFEICLLQQWVSCQIDDVVFQVHTYNDGSLWCLKSESERSFPWFKINKNMVLRAEKVSTLMSFKPTWMFWRKTNCCYFPSTLPPLSYSCLFTNGTYCLCFPSYNSQKTPSYQPFRKVQ